MRSRLVLVGALALGLGDAGGASPAAAAPTVETVSGWGGSGIGSFGQISGVYPGGNSIETVGQTFTPPVATPYLESLLFFVDTDTGQSAGPLQFGFYLYAWDGEKATGPALYSSDLIVTTEDPANPTTRYEAIEVEFDGLPLTVGQQYVAFLSSSEYFDDDDDAGRVGVHDSEFIDIYPGGQFVYLHNSDADFSRVTTTPWLTYNFPNRFYDLAFVATFSAVPEPASLALLALGGALVLPHRRQRSRS